jgi:hypothetical protein
MECADMTDARLDEMVAQAVLGLDTLWGGDVMSPSGTRRFIADSWFSDSDLPEAYSHPAAARVRDCEGLSAPEPDRGVIDAYLSAVDVAGAVAAIPELAAGQPNTRRAFLDGLGECLQVMWDLGMERLDRGDPVPYERSVTASTAAAPTPSDPTSRRERLRALLAETGLAADSDDQLLEAVDAWRSQRLVPGAAIPALAKAFIAELEDGTRRFVMPHLPSELQEVPRSNVRFLPIENAWFSGSMNYIGRARRPDGRPEYEATYELNASLEISIPEFQQLVSHEVVPGHVTTFAFVQHLYTLGRVGFEGTVLTMNTRYSTLAEGIANNAILMAHGVTEVEDLPDRDLQIGTLLALLQDDAKNQASYLTWKEGAAQPDVARILRREFVVSEERAEKLSGPWARHPLMGRMYLPAYRAGTEKVAELRRSQPPGSILPALFGCQGLVDVASIDQVL